MRADNNWEDNVGKRLFDFEGELPPQGWENISRQIAPKPKARRRWLWLPLLLVFLSLPVAFLWQQHRSKKLVSETDPAQPQTTTTTAQADNISKTSTHKNPDALLKHSAEMKQPATTSAANEIPETPAGKNAAEMAKAGRKNQPTTSRPNQIALPGIVANTKPEPEKKETSGEKSKRKTFTSKPVIAGTVASITRKKTVSNSPDKPVTKQTSNATIASGIKAKEQAAATGGDPEFSGNKLPETNGTTLPATTLPAGSAANNGAGKTISPAIITSPQNTVEETSNPAMAKENSGMQEMQTRPDSSETKAVLAEIPAADTTASIAKTEEDQEEKLEQEDGKKWLFGIYGAPQYTYQRVQANVTDEIMILRLNNKNNFEPERVGYELGFRSYYPVREKLLLEFGFHFSRLNQYLNFTTTSGPADSVVVSSQQGQVILETRNREQQQILLFKYFMGGMYAGGQVKISRNWQVSGGLGGNWLFWKNPDEVTVPIATKNFNPYLSAGLRYNHNLGPKLTLQAGPTLQYYLRPVQKETAFYKAKPTTFGFSIGLLFSHKN